MYRSKLGKLPDVLSHIYMTSWPWMKQFLFFGGHGQRWSFSDLTSYANRLSLPINCMIGMISMVAWSQPPLPFSCFPPLPAAKPAEGARSREEGVHGTRSVDWVKDEWRMVNGEWRMEKSEGGIGNSPVT